MKLSGERVRELRSLYADGPDGPDDDIQALLDDREELQRALADAEQRVEKLSRVMKSARTLYGEHASFPPEDHDPLWEMWARLDDALRALDESA